MRGDLSEARISRAPAPAAAVIVHGLPDVVDQLSEYIILYSDNTTHQRQNGFPPAGKRSGWGRARSRGPDPICSPPATPRSQFDASTRRRWNRAARAGESRSSRSTACR
jgi:hypothetical protein